MEYVIEQIQSVPTVYMRRTGAYGSENYKLMEALKSWAKQKGVFGNSIIYGIAQDGPDTPPDHCRYDVCLAASALPVDDAVQKGEIPAGKYAVFTIPHTAGAVQSFWGSFLQVLETEGLQFDGTRPLLERYKQKLVAEDGKCEFCVPIS